MDQDLDPDPALAETLRRSPSPPLPLLPPPLCLCLSDWLCSGWGGGGPWPGRWWACWPGWSRACWSGAAGSYGRGRVWQCGCRDVQRTAGRHRSFGCLLWSWKEDARVRLHLKCICGIIHSGQRPEVSLKQSCFLLCKCDKTLLKYPASYIPVLHHVQVPQFHDLLLSFIDISKLLDLLQWQQSG